MPALRSPARSLRRAFVASAVSAHISRRLRLSAASCPGVSAARIARWMSRSFARFSAFLGRYFFCGFRRSWASR